MIYSIYAALAALAVFSFLFLKKENLLSGARQIVISALLIAAAFLIRGLSLGHQTADFSYFLSGWLGVIRSGGGVKALSQSIGNYNVPYLYFLALISYLGSAWDLYMIKLLSIVFDVILAVFTLKLASVFTDSPSKRLASFLAALLLPTVLLNSSFWGQCDSIYTAFAVMSLYFALSGKPYRSVIAIALSFAVKLQAVFIMPVFFVLLLAKKIKLRHLLAFPAAYVVTILPAVLLGRPFIDTLTLYLNQASTVGSALNYNSSSVYAFNVYFSSDRVSSMMGIFAAFALVLIMFIIAIKRRKELDNKFILLFSLIFVIGIPYLLPHMHDRYFYMADVFTMMYGALYLKRIHIPILTSFASLLGYFAYLKGYYLIDMFWGAAALLAVLLWLIFDLISYEHAADPKSEISC